MAEALRPLVRNRLVLFGAGLIVLVALLALLADGIAPYDPIEMKVVDALKRPSAAHPFGTDRFGRDVLSRTIYGSRIALGVALSSIALAFVAGTALGLVGGYVGGWPDLLIGRVMDVLFSFPTLILAIAIAAMLGPGLNNAALAIAVVYVPLFSRVARGPVIAEREKDHVAAAQGLGAGWPRIVFRHILPNCTTPIIVQMSLDLGYAILTLAALSFIGLGAQAPTPEWGSMIAVGRDYYLTQWWYVTFPGLAIFVAVLAANLVGDGLQEVLSPHLDQ